MSLLRILLLNGIFLPAIYTQWRLYDTNEIDGQNFYDCLYLYWSEDAFERSSPREIIPYCIRLKDSFGNRSNPLPTNIRQRLTFFQLREQNRTATDLYNWYIPFDLIEQYDLYLESNDEQLSQQYVCQCNPSTFGSNCQYSFDSSSNFREIVMKQFDMKLRTIKNTNDIINQTKNGTCYTHIKCVYIVPSLCLDWREICDGKMDCLEGEDEEDCFQLEINECLIGKEYRCRNGLCIPYEFFDDGDSDCLDGSDEDRKQYEVECDPLFLNPSIICEEHFCGQGAFSCADSNCLKTYPIRTNENSEKCPTGRDQLFRKNQFISSTTRHIFHDDGSFTNNRCPSFQVFPSYPIIFGHVRFIYFMNDTDFLTNRTPHYVCFNKQWCSTFETTYIFDNLTCIDYDKLPLNRTDTNWDQLMVAVENVFKECSHEKLRVQDGKCSHTSLIPCENSSKCISKHRLIDSYQDCPNASDEFSTETCHLKLPHRYQCLQEDKCIPLNLIRDGKADCLDKSDEFIHRKSCHPFGKDICHLTFEKLTSTILFGQICDGIVHIPLSLLSNETDETNCHEWPCDTFYTSCDDVWNCPDGRDELKCQDYLYDCQKNMHFCLNINVNSFCSNHTFHCIGSSDDRHYCRKHNPENFYLRYRCLNDTKCISQYQLCDCQIDCPLHQDDENLLCQYESCQLNEYRCKNGKKAKRCDFKPECDKKEDEYLCDLTDIPKRERFFGLSDYDFQSYPLTQVNNHLQFKQIERVTPLNKLPKIFFGWYCNRGVLVRKQDFYECLCPPAYYGSHCEYENDRSSVILQLSTPPLIIRHIVFQLFIFLFDQNEEILSYEKLLHSDINACLTKYVFYLLSSNRSRKSFIRIDSFILTSAETIRYIQSWYFDIKFPFLPVNRIAARVALSIQPRSTVHCNQVACLHGQCMTYVNSEKIYCHCFHGWSGRSCNVSLNCQCSKGSFCLANRLCICPIGRMGPLCRVPYNICQSNRCKNNGTCLPLDARATTLDFNSIQQMFVCLCSEGFAGIYCEKNLTKIHIEFSDDGWSASSILIHLIKTSPDYPQLPRRRTLFKKHFHSKNLTIYNPFVDLPEYQPNLIYIQTFDNRRRKDYHLVGILPGKISADLLTSILPSNRCPHINELFPPMIVSYPRLQRIKYYPRICLSKEYFCFYDSEQMCLCNRFYHLDCFDFNHSLPICQESLCENNGLCIQDEENCQPKSICICDDCFYGSHCQLTTQQYLLSLDGILGTYILRDKHLTEQPFIIHLSIIVISSIFFLGILSNLCSILTLKQIKISDVGCRIYLLVASILSLLLMIIFLMKLIFLLITQIRVSLNERVIYISCILIEFSIRLFPSTIDWLYACVAIERTITVCFPGKFNRSESVQLAKYVINVTVILNIVSSIHDPISRRLTIDEEDQRLWCTVSYQKQSWLNSYNSSMNLIHFLLPFGINVLSALILIQKTARSRSNLHQKISYWKHLQIQSNQFKHLIISPCSLILLALPRLIISFIYSCMRQPRQPYLFLIAYWISFLPHAATFIIFVLPSSTYKKQFYYAFQKLFSLPRS